MALVESLSFRFGLHHPLWLAHGVVVGVVGRIGDTTSVATELVDGRGAAAANTMVLQEHKNAKRVNSDGVKTRNAPSQHANLSAKGGTVQ